MMTANEEESDEIALENMTLDGVITEGRKASNYGSMKMSDGTTYRFCDILEFEDHSKESKIVRIQAFVIEEKVG